MQAAVTFIPSLKFTSNTYILNFIYDQEMRDSMNSFTLSATIKKINRRKLIMPGIFLCFCIALLYTTGLYSLFSLPVVTTPAQASAAYHSKTPYANVRLSNLYYSGVNRTNGRKISACYYYTLYDNNCYYILISAADLGLDEANTTPPQHLSKYNCTARLESNISEIDTLNNLVSKNLDWTSQALNLMSSKVLINQYRMSHGDYALLALIVTISLIAIIHELIIIISLINPMYSRTVLRLSRYGSKTELFSAACEEFESAHAYAPGITLTDHFFIAYDKHNIHIVPLEVIVWAYKFGTMHTRLLHPDISYSLSVVTNNKKHYIVHHKTKDSVELVLGALQTRFPEILIGYSEGKSSRGR